MKAVISKGKSKGRLVEISQWCNDWFTVSTGIIEIDRKPFAPSSLVFTLEGINEIRAHKNNGMLFSWYKVGLASQLFTSKKGAKYQWTFRKIKRWKK